MFILVTVLCGFLGWIEWNRRIVKERRACVDEAIRIHRRFDAALFLPSSNTAPFPRNWLGDQMHNVIVVHQELGPDVFARIRDAYPEAKVISAKSLSSEQLDNLELHIGRPS